MTSFVLLSTFLVMAMSVDPDQWNLVHFSRTEIQLYECLENTNLQGILHAIDNTGFLERRVFRNLSINYNSFSFNIGIINASVAELVLEIRANFGNNQILRREDFLNALINCADPIQNRSTEGEVPHFINENPFVRDLLDYVLVDLDSFIGQTNGLRTFLTYARNALTHLQRAHNVFSGSYDLFERLRRTFRRRSVFFFDFAGEEPYIRHTYSSDRPEPYTRDDPSLFNTRRQVNLNERNPPISSLDIDTVMNIHPLYRSNRNMQRFYYYFYGVSMTESERYYEIRENRFYRAMFFYLELINRGLVDLNSDNTTFSVRDVPEDVLQILYSNTAYRQYFWTRHNEEINHAGGQILREARRNDEINLILAFYHRLTTDIHNSTTMKMTIFYNATSSTFKYEEPKREQVTLLPLELDSSKRKFHDLDSGPNTSKKFKDLQEIKDTNEEYYGYIVHNVLNQCFSDEEHLLFRVFDRVYSSLAKETGILSELRR